MREREKDEKKRGREKEKEGEREKERERDRERDRERYILYHVLVQRDQILSIISDTDFAALIISSW